MNGAVVAAAALVASLAGWALLAALERFTTKARATWTVAALGVAALSLAGPLSGADITAANKAWLALMHISVAAVLIPLLRRTTPWRARRAESTASVTDSAADAVPGGETR